MANLSGNKYIYQLKQVLSEVNILRTMTEAVNNIYTTKLIDLILPDVEEPEPISWVIIILDFLNIASDLKTQLIEGIPQLTAEHVRVIIYNLLSALKFVHEAGIMHRDIKPANILINHECQIKVCDFGSARPILENESFEEMTSD